MSANRIPPRFSFVFILAVLGGVAPGVARAALDPNAPVEVLSSQASEIAGKVYLEVQILMKGSVEGRPYSVPATVLYPESSGQCNGTGIVDIVNSSPVYAGYTDFCQVLPSFLCSPLGMPPPAATGRGFLGDSFIAGKGYVYLSVQVEKAAVDIYMEVYAPFGGVAPPSALTTPGVSPIPVASQIGRLTDGYQIVADGAELIRNLAARSELPGSPCSAAWTIAFGYSRSAMILRTILQLEAFGGVDIPNPRFDGTILGGAGGGDRLSALDVDGDDHADRDSPVFGGCYDLGGNPILPSTAPADWPFAATFPQPTTIALSGPPALSAICPGTFRAGSGKVMLVGTETESQLLSARHARGALAGYRVYEIAGTAHTPKAFTDASVFGAVKQNPIATAPVFRAMTENMRAWITAGTEPPSSVTLTDPTTTPMDEAFPGFLSRTLVFEAFPSFMNRLGLYQRDADENAMGGVRLPHVATRVGDKTMGAPLGAYSGVDSDIASVSLLGLPGGFFPSMAGIVLASGGSFVPFSAPKLAARYPTHGRYVSAVARAADHALEQRWILEEDRDAYVERASKCPVGQSDALTPAQLDFCSGL